MDFCFLMFVLVSDIDVDFVLCRFMWIFCLLAGFWVWVGIFPCLMLRKWLKTALFEFKFCWEV